MKQGQSTCNMNVSDSSGGAIKLKNGPNARMKTN